MSSSMVSILAPSCAELITQVDIKHFEEEEIDQIAAEITHMIMKVCITVYLLQLHM